MCSWKEMSVLPDQGNYLPEVWHSLHRKEENCAGLTSMLMQPFSDKHPFYHFKLMNKQKSSERRRMSHLRKALSIWVSALEQYRKLPAYGFDPSNQPESDSKTQDRPSSFEDWVDLSVKFEIDSDEQEQVKKDVCFAMGPEIVFFTNERELQQYE